MRHPQAFVIAVALLAALPGRAFAAAAPGSLVKLACPASASATHPCKAVYYYGSDRKRHAFPNERTYFSWYADFAGVKTVSAPELSAMPLGKSVTYRPGVKPVKFTTDPKTYAVGLGGALRWIPSETAAAALYGADWNRKTDDISDAFFADYRFGNPIASASDFSAAGESALAPVIDDNLPATRRSVTVATASGSFSVELIKMQRDRFEMLTAAAETVDCQNGCAAKPLKQYGEELGAPIGIHGTYFCPPDYPDCAGKTNTFLWPFFDTNARTMRNASSLEVHQGPMIATTVQGDTLFFHRTRDFGSSASVFEGRTGKTLRAAVSNYPSLVEGGVSVVMGESRLDEGMRTIRGVRGGIGYDDRFVYLVLARSATVPDLADVFVSLRATHALNLDGGGTSALLFDGEYAFGPGRQLPNAILFRARP